MDLSPAGEHEWVRASRSHKWHVLGGYRNLDAPALCAQRVAGHWRGLTWRHHPPAEQDRCAKCRRLVAH